MAILILPTRDAGRASAEQGLDKKHPQNTHTSLWLPVSMATVTHTTTTRHVKTPTLFFLGIVGACVATKDFGRWRARVWCSGRSSCLDCNVCMFLFHGAVMDRFAHTTSARKLKPSMPRSGAQQVDLPPWRTSHWLCLRFSPSMPCTPLLLLSPSSSLLRSTERVVALGASCTHDVWFLCAPTAWARTERTNVHTTENDKSASASVHEHLFFLSQRYTSHKRK